MNEASALIDLNLTSREAEVIYVALSRTSFTGVDDAAQALIRYKIERLIEEETGLSLHDYLLTHDAIPETTPRPDKRSGK